jgi:hypothetical protein
MAVVEYVDTTYHSDVLNGARREEWLRMWCEYGMGQGVESMTVLSGKILSDAI